MPGPPEDDDVKLFREAVRDVAPLVRGDARPTPSTKPRPRPQAPFARAERRDVLAESLSFHAGDMDLETGDELSFRRPGVQDAVLRRLRRGQYRLQAELDLHGLVVPEARAALRAFLAEALARNMRCVRIVHGKGLRSGRRGPVLKHTVNVLLRRTAVVAAFVTARPVDGGTGALYVLLASNLSD